MKLLFNLLKEESGQGLVEYSLIISLVILGAIGALTLFGEELVGLYNEKIVAKFP